jgi:hypothetical protein
MNRTTPLLSRPVIIPQGLKTSPVSTNQRHSTLKIQNPTRASESGPQFSPSSSPQLSPSLSPQESVSDDESDLDQDDLTGSMEDVKLSDVSSHNTSYITTPLYQNVTQKLIFCIQFMDGYTFRQLYEFFKMTLTTAPMFLSPDGITILRGNGNASLVANTQIRGHQLIRYEFHPQYANYRDAGSQRAIHVVNCPLVKFRENIKGIARKEGIRMFQYVGDPSVYIQVYGGNKNAEGHVTVKTEVYEHIEYQLGEYTQHVTSPNCKIPLVEFCTACNNIGKIRGCTNAKIICYPNGVSIVACSETGVTDRHNRWGDCNEDIQNNHTGPRLLIKGNPVSRSKPYSVKVSIDVIKALGKLTNLTNNGILRVYSECDGLVRFIISISYYAEMTLFLTEPQGQAPANE